MYFILLSPKSLLYFVLLKQHLRLRFVSGLFCVKFLSGLRRIVRSFVIAGKGPDPSAETFMSVQCASPGRGGEMVGVCGVCASCVGWRKG